MDGNPFADLVPQAPATPGSGAQVSYSDTQGPVTPDQMVTYRQLHAAGGIDPNADPGSARMPYAQRGDEPIPTDKFVVDTQGGVHIPQKGAFDDLVPAPKSDQGLGFLTGLTKPWDNAAIWARQGTSALLGQGVTDTIDDIGKSLRMATPDQSRAAHLAFLQGQAANGVVPGKIGNWLGELAGTAPTLALPGGPLAMGATSGALLTDDPHNLGRTAIDAGVGGVLGKAGDVVGRGILDTVAPHLSPAIQTLIGAGMKDSLTPGMIAGKYSLPGLAESAGRAVPIVGELIRKRGNEALEAGARAVAGKVANGFGGDAAGETAGEVADAVTGAKNAAYNITTPNGTELDPIYANRVADITNKVNSIPESTGLPQSFDRLKTQEIAARVNPATGVLDDEGVKAAKNAINSEIADFAGDSNGWSRRYIGHLKDLRSAVTENLGRSDPAAQAQLAGADANYPDYLAFKGAMRRGTQNSTTEGNWPVPQHFQSAITAQVGKGAPVSPDYQGLVDAMKEVLPRKFHDVVSPWHAIPEALVASGVAGSDVLGGKGGALTAGMLAGVPAYTRVGQDALRKVMLAGSGGRSAFEKLFGPVTNVTNPVFGLGAGQAASTVASPIAQLLAGLSSPAAVNP